MKVLGNIFYMQFVFVRLPFAQYEYHNLDLDPKPVY